jgi:hypothetical protein
MNGAIELNRRGSHLEADHACSDDDEPLARQQHLRDRGGVLRRAKRPDALEVGAGDRQGIERRSRCQKKLPVREIAPAVEHDAPTIAVDPADSLPADKIDAVFDIPGGRKEGAFVACLPPQQNGLRQRRTIVWQVGFVADQGD